MTILIRAEWSHARSCQRAARLLRELDGIGDGMSLDGVAAMLIADDLDDVVERIRKAYAAEGELPVDSGEVSAGGKGDGMNEELARELLCDQAARVPWELVSFARSVEEAWGDISDGWWYLLERPEKWTREYVAWIEHDKAREGDMNWSKYCDALARVTEELDV